MADEFRPATGSKQSRPNAKRPPSRTAVVGLREEREAMNSNLGRELAERKAAHLSVESEALQLARSIRRARARTLRHNRRVLQTRAGRQLLLER